MNRKYEKAIEIFEKIISNYKLNKEKVNELNKSLNNKENINDNSFNSFDDFSSDKENDCETELSILNSNTQNNDINNNFMNINLFNSILDCCVEANNVKKMEEIFSILENDFLEQKDEKNEKNTSTSIKLDIITYSILIKGYAKGNKADKVKEIYEKISDNKEFKLDEMLYNTILDCFARENDEVSVMRIFEEMKNKSIKFSVATFGVLIKMYLNLDQAEKAFKLYEEYMVNENSNSNENNNNIFIKPSIVIYQMLIKNLIKTQNKIQEGIEMFKKMQKNSILPDSNIYELIIRGCLDNEKIKEAGDLILEALNQKIKVENFLIANFVEKFELNFKENSKKNSIENLESSSSTSFTDSEKTIFIHKLIDALNTKSQNVELNSLNVLRKIQQELNGNKTSSINSKENSSNYTFTPDSSIYSLPNFKNSIYNSNNEKKSSTGPYIFSEGQGISHLKKSHMFFSRNENNNNIRSSIEENNKIYKPAKYINSNIENKTINIEPEQKSKYVFNQSPPTISSLDPISNSNSVYISNNNNQSKSNYNFVNPNENNNDNLRRGNYNSFNNKNNNYNTYNNYNSNNNCNRSNNNNNANANKSKRVPDYIYKKESSIYG
jgi:pentatricopeptide repeat protein